MSVVGDSFYTVALIIAVLTATHSVTSGAMVLIAGTVPVVALTLVGGTLGDRLPRNYVMLSSDLVRAAAQFVMAAMLMRPDPPLWALMCVQAFYGVGEAFFDPASTGLLPQIVESGDLAAANTLIQALSNSALIIGPAIAGIIIGLCGAPLVIALDALSFVASAVTLYFVIIPHAGTLTRKGGPIMHQLLVGFNELCSHRWVLVTTCYTAVLAFAYNGTVLALGPQVALSRLGGSSAWSFMLSGYGAGLIFGSLLAFRLLKTKRALGWAYVATIGLAPLLALLGSSHSISLVVGASAIAGTAVSIFSVTFTTLLQQTVPTEVISRLASYFWLARVAATPIAFSVVGSASLQFGTSTVFIVAAILVCVATLISVAIPDIWSIRHTIALAEKSGCKQ